MVKKWDKEGIFRIIKLLLIMLGVVCVLKMYYTYCLKPDLPEHYAFHSIAASEEQISDMDVFAGETIMEQAITVSRNDFNGFQLMFRKKDGGVSQPDVKVELVDCLNSQIVETWNVDNSKVIEYLFQDFDLKEPIRNSMDRQYLIRVFSSDMEHIAPAVTNYASYTGGDLYVGNHVQTSSLIFTLNSSTMFVKELYAIFCLVVLGGVLVLWILFQKNHKKEENYFLVLGIVWGMLFMIFFSPNTTPDERAHEATVYAKVNSILGKEALDKEGNVIVREVDASLTEMNDISLETIEYTYSALSQNTNEKRTSFPRGPLNVSITAHFPQTLGVMVGWLLKANGMVTLYLGKIIALIFYLISCYFAIKWIPWGKMVLMIITLFPMSLELAGSFSYDCTVNAICFLFFAYVMRLVYEQEKVGWKDYIFLAILAVWMAPCKVVYVFVCGLIFAVPSSEKGIMKKDTLGKILVFGAGIIAVLIQRLSSINSIITAEQGVTVAKQGVDGFTLNYILSNPKQSIGMIFKTVFAQDELLFGSTVGNSLGLFQVHISWVIIFGFVLLLCCSVISDYNNKQCMCRKMKYMVSGLSLIIVAAIAMSMWLDATPQSFTYIEGMQGRYFLPILPMLMMTLKNNTVVVQKDIKHVLISGTFVLELLTMFEVWLYIVR